jgi:[ribosomal protein S5]-alanine N-acetyltransferase
MPRLELTPPGPEDVETIFSKWAQDPEVTKYLSWRTAESRTDLLPYIQRCLQGWADQKEFTWLVVEAGPKAIIGSVSVRVSGHRAEMGYVLQAASWGRGYIKEVVNALVGHCFRIAAIYRVSAVCDIENARSARVLEKAGLQREGLLRGWTIHPQTGGIPRDCWSYSIVRPELETLSPSSDI